MISVTAPMAGKILSVARNVGYKVEEDETIFVMEAMKMEIPIVAPAGGIIRDILVEAGQTVEADAVLAVIE